MLVVTVEVWPGGDRARADKIGELRIANLSGLAPVSDYQWEFDGGGRGVVVGHRRSDGCWTLIRRVIDAARDARVIDAFLSHPSTAQSLKRGSRR